eukprot:3883100-Rhodomonas_salina.1
MVWHPGGSFGVDPVHERPFSDRRAYRSQRAMWTQASDRKTTERARTKNIAMMVVYHWCKTSPAFLPLRYQAFRSGQGTAHPQTVCGTGRARMRRIPLLLMRLSVVFLQFVQWLTTRKLTDPWNSFPGDDVRRSAVFVLICIQRCQFGVCQAVGPCGHGLANVKATGQRTTFIVL